MGPALGLVPWVELLLPTTALGMTSGSAQLSARQPFPSYPSLVTESALFQCAVSCASSSALEMVPRAALCRSSTLHGC